MRARRACLAPDTPRALRAVDAPRAVVGTDDAFALGQKSRISAGFAGFAREAAYVFGSRGISGYQGLELFVELLQRHGAKPSKPGATTRPEKRIAVRLAQGAPMSEHVSNVLRSGSGQAEEVVVMKPVVSSIVALVLAIAPFTAMASADTSASMPSTSKTGPHTHVKTVDDTEAALSPPVATRVRHRARDHKKDALRPVLHHASHVEVGGAGHKEPKIEKGVQVIPAALAAKLPHGKLTHVSHVTKADTKPVDMPKLPNPNATKASKAGAEKGARKASEKKNADSADKDGQPWRDEEMSDLVARIVRGKRSPKAEPGLDVSASLDVESKAKASSPKAAPCAKDPVEVIRGPEVDTFALTTCDGAVAPLAVEHLSVSVRPGSAARPTLSIAELAKTKGRELAKGIRRVDPRLASRLQAFADHFGKAGSPVKLSVVSGYRPTSVGSTHATGRAIDFRVEGAENEEVVAFCKTLPDTGCGFYPNSSFVHLDVRDVGAGHVSWIDASETGESPRYVSTWPQRQASRVTPDKLEPAAAKQPIDKPALEPTEESSGAESVDETP